MIMPTTSIQNSEEMIKKSKMIANVVHKTYIHVYTYKNKTLQQLNME